MMITDSTADGSRSDVTAGAAGEKKYKGVRKRKWGRWVSEIRLPNSRERIWLGSYDAPEKAARAFDAASVCLRGPHGANLNFPDSPPQVSCNSRNSHMIDPQEIQAVAVSHANKAPSSTPVPEPSQSTSTVTSASTTTMISTMEETSAEPITDYWFYMDNMLSPAGIQPGSLVDDFTYNHYFSSMAVTPLDEPEDAGG